MPELNNLTAAEIRQILPPSEPGLGADALDEARAARVAFFDAEKLRLDTHTAILEAWRGRIRVFAPPAQPQSLQELVEAARHKLRGDRVAADQLVLDRRALLIDAIRAEVAR